MRKIIHNLRSQPHEIKIYILYIATSIAGVILFALWVYSFGGDTSEPANTANLQDELEPLSAIKANIIDGYHEISN